MKKVILIALAICLLASGVAFAGVAGSLHDLGLYGKVTNAAGTGSGQVCVFCHHPHRGRVTFGGNALTNAILWNITDWSPTAYPVYDSGVSSSMNATGSADVLNDGNSNAYASFFCMACHDGTIGQNALVRAPRDGTNTTTYTLPGAANLGTSLEDDHPVNFTVNTALVTADKELKTLGTNSWWSTKLNAEFPVFGGKMQCATCHDVHRGTPFDEDNCDNAGSAASCDNTIEFMLGDTTNSQICTDCHIK